MVRFLQQRGPCTWESDAENRHFEKHVMSALALATLSSCGTYRKHLAKTADRIEGSGYIHPIQFLQPSDVIILSAPQASWELILELPRVRSANVIGVSRKRAPTRFSRHRISS